MANNIYFTTIDTADNRFFFQGEAIEGVAVIEDQEIEDPLPIKETIDSEVKTKGGVLVDMLSGSEAEDSTSDDSDSNSEDENEGNGKGILHIGILIY